MQSSQQIREIMNHDQWEDPGVLVGKAPKSRPLTPPPSWFPGWANNGVGTDDQFCFDCRMRWQRDPGMLEAWIRRRKRNESLRLSSGMCLLCGKILQVPDNLTHTDQNTIKLRNYGNGEPPAWWFNSAPAQRQPRDCDETKRMGLGNAPSYPPRWFDPPGVKNEAGARSVGSGSSGQSPSSLHETTEQEKANFCNDCFGSLAPDVRRERRRRKRKFGWPKDTCAGCRRQLNDAH